VIKTGKGLIAIILIVVVIAVVAFVAYPMFSGGENKAKALQPDMSVFPEGWSVESSESVADSAGLMNKTYLSREWYVKSPTERVVVSIQVFPSADKATEDYNRLYGFFGPGTPVSKFDKCFKSSGNDYYFQKGNAVGQVLIVGSSLTPAQINAILDNIAGKA